MKNKLIKKILVGTASVFLLLVAVLAVHIYIVTRPKPADAYTKAMARIDIKQPINQEDANKIATWLYQQKGVDHVLVNTQTDIVVFSFFPIKTTANEVVGNFKTAFNYKAERYVPTEAEIQGGCPAASSSSFKIYKFFQQIF